MKEQEVRSLSGTPTANDFDGYRGTPLVINRTNGSENVYLLNDADEIINVKDLAAGSALAFDFLLMGG